MIMGLTKHYLLWSRIKKGRRLLEPPTLTSVVELLQKWEKEKQPGTGFTMQIISSYPHPDFGHIKRISDVDVKWCGRPTSCP